MPELPEVQTTVQGLQILVNNEIAKIKIYSTKLRYKIPKNIPKTLKHNKITKIFRIGKYIIVNLKGNNSLIFHLGMSGRLRIIKSSKFVRKKHDHFILITKKNILIFNDIRKFGFIDLLKTKKIYKRNYIIQLGIEHLGEQYQKVTNYSI